MLKSRFTIIGLILIAFTVYMQYRGSFGEWQSIFKSKQSVGSNETPSLASGYVGASQPAKTSGPAALKPFEEQEYNKMSEEIKLINIEKLNVVKQLKDYTNHCVNVFIPKITSSEELGLKVENELNAQKVFNIILSSSDIKYVGYYNTPQGMNAILKIREGGANVLKAGESLANTNMRLKALNERYVLLENMLSHSEERVYITQR